LPLVLLHLLFMGLGRSGFLSALPGYIRDVTHITGLITNILMFISAVFYPISVLPENYQVLLRLNPLATIITESRNTLIFGQSPDWSLLTLFSLLGIIVALLGYWWFQKMRKGFADVI